uniref:Protein BTN n=1 Tax=Bionectria ochroleuca TaxID=29856 RepID=A0A8H7NK13_BIOOC
MAATRQAPGDTLRTVLGFSLIAFANTLMPLIIYSSAYLIICFPRPIVNLIQTVPALVGKLLLPQLLRSWLPYWFRPLLICFGWIGSAVIAEATPPNVDPRLRILCVVLASIQAAGGDVTWLGNLRHYGKPGLVGWGIGSGAGSAVSAVLPYFITVTRKMFLRDAVGYIVYLVPVVIVSHFFILPPFPTSESQDRAQHSKDDKEKLERYEPAGMSLIDAPTKPMKAMERIEANNRILSRLASPYVIPLFMSSIGYAVLYPGFVRAMGIVPSFDRYTSYLAAYGLIFQLGNCMARSCLTLIRFRNTRLMFALLGLVFLALLCNSVFSIATAPILVFPLVFIGGFATGAIYIDVFASLVEHRDHESGADLEFALGAVGVGEPAGMLLGGLIATVLEQWLCGSGLAAGERWCHTTW